MHHDEQRAGAPDAAWACVVSDVEWRFPATARTVPEARRRIASTLAQWKLDGLTEVIALLTSEIVTNAVLHARTDIRIGVTREPHGVRVEVTDGSPLPPSLRHHSDTATTGRGIRLLDALADAWSAEPDNGGKTVWFTVSSNRDPWVAAEQFTRERER